MKRFRWFVASALLGLFSATGGIVPSALAQDDDEKPFGVGSQAPALDIEHWISNGQDAFKPVTEFEPGYVYVVEFWATWCPPCIASMPHLAEAQGKYKDQKVQLISVSDEDLDTVNEFLEGNVRGSEDQTYAQLTSAYCLTADPDKSVHADYMDASNQSGIPTAFIIGKTGLVEWIGHPTEMDKPLEQIVAGTWDLEAAIKEAEEAAEAQRALQEVFEKFQQGEFEEGVELLDKVISTTKDERMAKQLRGMKLNVMLQSGSFEESDVMPVAKEFLKSVESEPRAVNNVTWMIHQKAEEGFFTDKSFIGGVAGIAEQAAAASDEDYAWKVWDTAGHLYFLADNLEKALECQKKAVENPGSEQAPEVAEFLKKLEDSKK